MVFIFVVCVTTVAWRIVPVIKFSETVGTEMVVMVRNKGVHQ